MATELYKFTGWIKVQERYLPLASEFSGEYAYREIPELEMHATLDNDTTFQISIEKALSSMSDTANIVIPNHKVLEQLYIENWSKLKEWDALDLEVSIMLYYQYPHAEQFRDKCNCIFTGDIIDISINESTSTLDQGLMIKAASGYKTASRAIVHKTYAANLTYRDIMFDLFRYFEPFGYDIPVVRDPDVKLGKTLNRDRSFSGKVVDALNEIAKDLDMVWGFDSNPWTYLDMAQTGLYDDTPANLNALEENRRCYFVDKRAVFDVTGIHETTGTEPPISGVNGIRVSGDTSHQGLIGYTKSQFSFNAATEPLYNIGMPVYADDVSAHLVEQRNRSVGRINRISINNDRLHAECSFIDENTGLAILEKDGRNTGALVL